MSWSSSAIRQSIARFVAARQLDGICGRHTAQGIENCRCLAEGQQARHVWKCDGVTDQRTFDRDKIGESYYHDGRPKLLRTVMRIDARHPMHHAELIIGHNLHTQLFLRQPRLCG